MTAETNTPPKPKVKEPIKQPPVAEMETAEFGAHNFGRSASAAGSPTTPSQSMALTHPAAHEFSRIVMRQVALGGTLNLPEYKATSRLRETAVLQMQQHYGNAFVQRKIGQAYGKAGPAWVQRDRGTPTPSADAGTSDGGTSKPVETSEMTKRLDEIEQKYRDMIKAARGKSANVAADNLERFLSGTGGVKSMDVTWLRSFEAVTDAERKNQERFEASLGVQAETVPHGETKSFNDHWDRMLTGGQTTELYYASGTSTIRSTGNFTLSTIENEVSISGTVQHRWFDPYDWHAGLSAVIPGFGSISDEDALLLQQYRGAKPFEMEAKWQQTLSGHVTVKKYWFDKESFKWSGP